MLRIIYLILLTFLATVSLHSQQCNNELDITVLSTFCTPNPDTGDPDYYVYFTVDQSLTTTSFYTFFAGNPAVTGQHPYNQVHVVGPLNLINGGIILTVIDGQNSSCTETSFIQPTELCTPLECTAPPLTLDIIQETICPGETIGYTGPNPDIYSREGFQVTEQLSTVPFGENTQFLGTIGGRANSSIYAQPNTWYYVRLAYSLVTQAGPQYDYDCTLLSNVDSFYVGGTDLSHINFAYDLNCIEAELELTAAIEDPIPPVIIWSRNGAAFSTQNTVTITEAGEYTVSTTDAAGCSNVQDIVVLDSDGNDFPTEFTIQGCPEEPVYCLFPFNDSWTIEWPEGVEADFNCSSNLTPGESYDITLSNGFGCSETITYVAEFPQPNFLFAEAIPGEDCESGSVRIIVEVGDNSDGMEVYITQLDGDFSTLQTYESGEYFFADIPPGTYTIDGFTFNQCNIFGGQFTISSGGPRIFESEVIAPLCNGEFGFINLFVTDGQGEITYNWADLPGNDNQMNRTELLAGTYTVTVSDENDCNFVQDFVLEEPTPIEVEVVSLVNASCGQNNGFIGLEITGGAPGPNLDYQTFWSNGWDTPNNFNLTAGDYTVTITDRNGCSVVETFTVEETGLEVIIDPTVPFITCATPSIQLFGNPGNPDNTFNWTGPNGFTSNESFIDITEPGEYTLQVIDINDCEGSSSIVIGDETQTQEATLTATPVTCDVPGSLLIELGDFDGESNLTVYFVSQDGNTRQFIYGNDINFEPQYVINDLASGFYEVVITTEYGCQSTQTILIENQTPIELISAEITDIACAGETGSIDVTFSSPNVLTYLWSTNNITSEDLTDIEEPGLYTLTVTDDLGCVAQFSFIVNQIGGFIGIFVEQANPVCGEDEGTLCALLEIGEGSYTYLWEDGSTEECFITSIPGTYTVTVTNATTGCSEVASGTLLDRAFDINLDVVNPSCGANNGSINADSGFNLPNATFEWSNGEIGRQISNLAPGDYSVTVTSVQGCVSEAAVTLVDIGEISFTVETTNVLCDGTLGTFEVQIPESELAIELQIYGPNGLVFLSPVNGQTVITVVNAPADIYELVITYPNDCSATQTVIIENESTFGAINFSVINPSCQNNDGSITIITENTTPSTTYSWSNGAATQTIENLSAGEYFVTMSDGADCIYEGSVRIDNEAFYDLDVVQPSCGQSDGIATVNPINGYEIASVLWSNGETSLSAVDLPLGTNSVVVTSTDGCTAEQFFEIIETGFTVSLAFEGQQDCDEGVVLRPSYSADFDETDLDHEWLLPNGDILNFTIGGLFVQEPGLYTYTATDITNGCQATATIFVPDFGGECHNLSGRLFADEGNCVYDGTEVLVPSWRVEIEATVGGFSTTAFTDNSGNWNAQVPTGTFTVRALPYVAPLYTECVPLQTVTVTNNNSAMVDVLMPYTDECASMYANVTIPFLRRCFENEFYIFYCNDGPVVAEDAQLIVEMDPFLDFIEASITPSNIEARTVTFDLGDLPPFFCGTISVTALVSCEAELGQTHCVEVTATPNDPCPEPDNWNGANLTIDADCDGDEVTFSLKNNGTAPMTVPLSYIVIEDGIMLMEGPQPGPVLDAGESFEFIFPADGSTYYVQANQEPGNPAFDMPTLVVEGCGVDEDGNFTTGLVNNLPLGDNSTNWYDISCRQNGGSYDPNAKEGFPLGFGDRNYIAEGTKLTYDIYFQNTGTDTAFTVVIRDTLAAELDPATLRMGAASHAYSADLDSNNVLTITFDNILLPDSNVNLLESQGVVQFTIDHTIGLAMETEIRNDADIYFDFNEPITTNNTLHTLGDDFLPTEVRDIVIVTGGLEVYPNPTKDRVNFTLDLPGVGPYKLRLYDAFGRELRTQTQTELTGDFDLSGLPRGWYLLRGENEGQGARAAVRILLQ